MSNQVQIRRDGSTALNASVPALAELGYNTTDKRLHLGDGSTSGGMPCPNRNDVQNNAFTGLTAAGTANTLTGTLTGFTYTALASLKIKISTTNTTAATLNINSLGAKNIYKNVGGTIGAISAGDLLAGYVYELMYDGTQFLIMGGSGGGGTLTVQRQIFTASGTWNKPSGLIAANVFVIGGGAGGGGVGVTTGNGTAGGTSSFGSHCSATGGAGGESGTAASRYWQGGAAGVGSSGDVNSAGAPGSPGLPGNLGCGGNGGSSHLGGGARGQPNIDANGTAAGNYGSGGSGGSRNAVTITGGGGGGAGGHSRKMIAAGTLGSSETVTVGAAGGGHNGGTRTGGSGSAGIVFVDEYIFV